MIRIIAQEIDETDKFEPPWARTAPAKPSQPNVPLADEDPEEFPSEDFTEILPELPREQARDQPPAETKSPVQPPEPAIPPMPESSPLQEEEPPFPEEEFEEITEEPTELDRLNQSLSIREKLEAALAGKYEYALRIIYTTLKGHTTERTVHPDYEMHAKTTGNRILIAWDELRSGWRGFIVDRIRAAKLESKNA